MDEQQLSGLLSFLGCEQGDVVLIVADKDRVVLPVLGQLRLTLGRQLGLIPGRTVQLLVDHRVPVL